MKTVISFFLAIVFLSFSSCVETPSRPERNNPHDGRNPDSVPEVLSINTGFANGFTNTTSIPVHLELKAATQIKICEVASQDSNLNVNWQDADTLVTVQIQSGDGEKWIGCQAKALNGNESAVKYASIKLDTRASISSFEWSSTGGDTLVPEDRVTFTLRTSPDAFGTETGGDAVVTVEGWDGIDLVDQADGSYTGSYTITRETPEVSHARVLVTLTDRAGNEVTDEANETLTAWWTPATGTERSFPLGNSGESIVMCWIPSGSFQMGSPDNEQDRYGDEGPVHMVTFAKGFWMSKYEITNREFVLFLNSVNRRGPNGEEWFETESEDSDSHILGSTGNFRVENGYEDHPMIEVSWYGAMAFCAWLSDFVEGSVNLPSEAQWEYACRAGTSTRFYWGDDSGYDDIDRYAVYSRNDPGHTAEKGTKLPNAWGLHDMSGNVWEWCEDWYHDDYNGAPEDGSAWTSPSGSSRVLRGGSWNNNPNDCRCADRNYFYPNVTNNNNGFRVVGF